MQIIQRFLGICNTNNIHANHPQHPSRQKEELLIYIVKEATLHAILHHRVFGGMEALTPAAVFWFNVPIVWGLNLEALTGATFGHFEVAIIAV